MHYPEKSLTAPRPSPTYQKTKPHTTNNTRKPVQKSGKRKKKRRRKQKKNHPAYHNDRTQDTGPVMWSLKNHVTLLLATDWPCWLRLPMRKKKKKKFSFFSLSANEVAWYETTIKRRRKLSAPGDVRREINVWWMDRGGKSSRFPSLLSFLFFLFSFIRSRLTDGSSGLLCVRAIGADTYRKVLNHLKEGWFTNYIKVIL